MTEQSERPIASVLIVGHGTMGSGIALTFANAGFATMVLSRDPARLPPLPHGMTASATLPEAPPDLILESVPEEMALKHALFARLEQRYGTAAEGPILATNTSGLALEEIAAPLAPGSRSRFLAIHYMHPADTLPMVECASLEETRAEVVARSRAALERTGKQVILLRKPVKGFLINRLQHALLHEAYHLIETGVVSVEDVDSFARQLFGPRMCITGLIEQKDLSGLKVHALAQASIVPALHHSPEPNRMVQEMVAAGKSFYDWSGRDADAERAKAKARLGRLVDFLDGLRAEDDGKDGDGRADQR